MSGALLSVKHLCTTFRTRSPGSLFRYSEVKAVDDVSFEILDGEVLSLVGESGCGKSTIGRVITRLQDAQSGMVTFAGRNILDMSARQFRPLRKDIQMIFQDPFASLNPRLRIERTLAEPLYIQGLVQSRNEAQKRIANMLRQVGLDADAMQRFPHEFSGGQRQRIGIARVMIVEPRLIIADEAVSALDVSIQAQVLNLIKKLQKQSGVSMLFISHDLGVVRHISDRVAVMQHGKIVEISSRKQLFENPQHPYTHQLLKSRPRFPVAFEHRIAGQELSGASGAEQGR